MFAKAIPPPMRVKREGLGGRCPSELTVVGRQEKWIENLDELRVFVEYREGELGKCLDNARNDLGIGELGALVPCQTTLPWGSMTKRTLTRPVRVGPRRKSPSA